MGKSRKVSKGQRLLFYPDSSNSKPYAFWQQAFKCEFTASHRGYSTNAVAWPSYSTVCRSKYAIVFITIPLNYFKLLKCLFSIFITSRISILYNYLEHHLRWNNDSNVLDIRKMNRLKVCIFYCYIHLKIVLQIFNWWILELGNDYLFWIPYQPR